MPSSRARPRSAPIGWSRGKPLEHAREACLARCHVGQHAPTSSPAPTHAQQTQSIRSSKFKPQGARNEPPAQGMEKGFADTAREVGTDVTDIRSTGAEIKCRYCRTLNDNKLFTFHRLKLVCSLKVEFQLDSCICLSNTVDSQKIV